MKFSKRSPLLRNNMEEFNKIIGSLGEEIKEQTLGNIDGGTGIPCVSVNATIVATASSQGCIKASLEVSAVASAAGAWGNNKITQKYKCGNVYTATAECWGC